jgi:hypothetical protein
MNSYVNEDVMWQRLKDLQREAENRRLLRGQDGRGATDLMRFLARRAWLLAGMAMRRPPRPSWVEAPQRAEPPTRKVA